MTAPTDAGSETSTPTKRLRRSFQPEQVTLDNGLRVLLVENPSIPAISFNLNLLAGASRESEELAGVAVMVSRMLDEGTRTRSSLEIAEAIESVGGAIETDGGHDRIGVFLGALSKDIDLGMELVADIVLDPAFNDESIEKDRERTLAEIRSARDRPQVVAGWEFNELVYKGHPLHRPAHGYPETIEAIERGNLRGFHESFFVPNNAIVSVVGDFATDDMLKRIENHFGAWKPRAFDDTPIARPVRQAEVRRGFVPISSRQAHVYFGHLGIDRRHPDFYALQVMDSILGGGAGLTARIPRKLRDEEGLAYTTFASITSSAGVDPGKFVAYIGTSPENVERAIAGFIQEIERIVTEPVTDQELNDARAYLTGSFVFAFESSGQIARFLTNAEVFDLGFDYVDKYPTYIDGVTAEDILRVARTHLDTRNYSLVIAGPEEPSV